jgi:hypothetical protein
MKPACICCCTSIFFHGLFMIYNTTMTIHTKHHLLISSDINLYVCNKLVTGVNKNCDVLYRYMQLTWQL